MMPKLKTERKLWVWAVVVFCVVVGTIAAGALWWKQGANVTNFEECKNAGGTVMESFPEQCAIHGKSFTNDKQQIKGDTNDYIGLSEKAALDKAAAANKAARVVERDGESLPVDMSLQPGRLNMYVKDGNVYKIQVEGEEGQ